jgi:hypothetical protein
MPNRDTFYKLLGMTVWHGGKTYMRRRYGPTYVPKPVLGGAVLALVAAVAAAVLAARRNGSE